MRRPNWIEWGMNIALAVSDRSEDPWAKVGAIVMTPEHLILGLGYNGAPSGIEIDWSSKDSRRPFVIHAELNALRMTNPIQAKDGILITTRHPCAPCLTAIASYQIKTVHYLEEAGQTHSDLDHIANTLGIHIRRLV